MTRINQKGRGGSTGRFERWVKASQNAGYAGLVWALEPRQMIKGTEQTEQTGQPEVKLSYDEVECGLYLRVHYDPVDLKLSPLAGIPRTSTTPDFQLFPALRHAPTSVSSVSTTRTIRYCIQIQRIATNLNAPHPGKHVDTLDWLGSPPHSHGNTQSLNQWSFDQIQLPESRKLGSTLWPSSFVADIRPMGSLHGSGTIGQRLPSRGRKGECAQGANHWRCVETRQSRRFIRLILTRCTEGELIDLIEEFSDGRVQFAFVKVKDPNTGLPKNVLIAWVCMG